MAHPVPPQIALAVEHLRKAANAAENREVDLDKAPWAEIEKTVIKVLLGAFAPDNPDHQMAALGLAGILADRLIGEHQAFWFFDRDTPGGASLGFPGALAMLSPVGAVFDALAHAQLGRLEGLVADIRRSLGEARFAGPSKAPMRLTADDYQRLFDPGFLQFLAVDPAKANEAWGWPPERVSREIKDAISRAAKLPQDARGQLESQLAGALDCLERGKPVIDQAERAPRVAELVAHLFGTREGTGFAPEELWQDLVLPLLYVGAPDKFPPLDPEDLEAYRQGADVVALFADVVPFQMPAAEDGLLGVFPPQHIHLAHEKFSRGGPARLIKLGKEAIVPALKAFDAAKARDAVQRFTAYLEEKSGMKRGGASPLLDASIQLLEDLKKVILDPAAANADLYLRRTTEAEAASETALALVRDALKAPRIILA